MRAAPSRAAVVKALMVRVPSPMVGVPIRSKGTMRLSSSSMSSSLTVSVSLSVFTIGEFHAHVRNTLSEHIQALYNNREGSRAARCPAVRSTEAKRTLPTNLAKTPPTLRSNPSNCLNPLKQTHYTYIVHLLQFRSDCVSFETATLIQSRPNQPTPFVIAHTHTAAPH